MMSLNESMKTTFVIVTHEMEVAAQMKTIMLRDGYLVQPENYTTSTGGQRGRAPLRPCPGSRFIRRRQVRSAEILDSIRLAWGQIKRRKVVTALCMTGISIGCAAIIVAISIGNGAQSYLETEIIGGMKLDEITVTPQSTGGPGKAAANRREENGIAYG